jgi:hypothetical protein
LGYRTGSMNEVLSAEEKTVEKNWWIWRKSVSKRR